MVTGSVSKLDRAAIVHKEYGMLGELLINSMWIIIHIELYICQDIIWLNVKV
jgi:hypothetical protein